MPNQNLSDEEISQVPEVLPVGRRAAGRHRQADGGALSARPVTSDPTQRDVDHVAELLASVDALLVTAGAGMGVDSGLPDFRSPGGFWSAYPPLAALGLSFEDMAQPHWFETRPEMAWAWYGHRKQLYRETRPHGGFGLLRRWTQVMRAGSFVVTSNVDGQFQAAGFPEDRILEVHGSIHRLQCTTPCSREVWKRHRWICEIDLATLQAGGALPRCPLCGALARPNVLMFNDGAWVEGPTTGQYARFAAWCAGLKGRPMAVIECGADGPSRPFDASAKTSPPGFRRHWCASIRMPRKRTM